MKPQWNSPPRTLKAASSEVHVWRVGLVCYRSSVDDFFEILTGDERTRAERFYFQEDRNRFVIARAALRTILGGYCCQNPRQIRFCYNQYGKPRLRQDFQDPPLFFNLSHSRDIAVVAVTQRREVGVDVEFIRAGFADEQIAEHFFSPLEVRAIRALPKERQDEAFFHCWTRKEAYIKARGEGLSIPLHKFDVSLALGQPAALLSAGGRPEELFHWTLCDLTPAAGYAGAIVAEGQNWELKCWEWSDKS